MSLEAFQEGPKEGRAPAYAPDFPTSFGKNQHLDLKKVQSVEPSVAEELEQIVSHFRAPIRYAFAYGSGVFKQAGYTSKVCAHSASDIRCLYRLT